MGPLDPAHRTERSEAARRVECDVAGLVLANENVGGDFEAETDVAVGRINPLHVLLLDVRTLWMVGRR